LFYGRFMATPPEQAAPATVRAGRPAWRVAVAAEADRLGAQLAAALDSPDGPQHDPSAVLVIRRAIDQARQIATGKVSWWRTLPDWWYGTSIESSWQALHRAAEQLVMVQPPAALQVAVPYLESLATATFGADHAAAEQHALAGVPGTGPNRLVAQRILVAYHVRSDTRHQQVRQLRNLLYVFLVVVAAIDCALWATGVTSGAVVGLGALAGTVSVAFAIRGGSPSGPYNLLPAQSLLKVTTGAATAIMAVKVLDFASNVPASTARDSVYAIVFGFSQQAFTRLVDQRADALTKGPDARGGQGTGGYPGRNG
jgi:hypothetical protein